MVITLCGSARFEHLFHAWNEALTLSGHVVFGLATYPSVKGKKEFYNEHEKALLDKAHKLKIDNSDCVLVLNRFAYIGESTMSEIEHAISKNKMIVFIESWAKGNGICSMHTEHVQRQCMAATGGVSSTFDTYKYHCYPTKLLEFEPRKKVLDMVTDTKDYCQSIADSHVLKIVDIVRPDVPGEPVLASIFDENDEHVQSHCVRAWGDKDIAWDRAQEYINEAKPILCSRISNPQKRCDCIYCSKARCDALLAEMKGDQNGTS
jgi:hypothetical protein